jgi:hypothetical protein
MSVSAFRGLKVTEHEVPGGDAPKVVNPHHRTALDFSGRRSITLGQIGGERSSKKIRFEIKRKPENLGRIRVESLISILKETILFRGMEY